MRITLHIGAWKTGSTAIQNFLVENTADLRAQGVFVPDSMDRPSRPFVRNRLLSNEPQDIRLVLNELRQLTEGAGEDANIVFSSEHFWQLTQEEIARIGQALRPLTEDVQIVLYVRPQDDMWNSLYSQQAKSFLVSPSAPVWGTADYVAHSIATWAIYYDTCLSMFAKVFGSDAVHARMYQRDRLRGGDVALDFMDHLGVDDTGMSSPRATSNPSLGWKGVAFSLWLYEHLKVRDLPHDDFHMMRHAFRSAVRKMTTFTGDDAWMGKSPNILTLAERREIRTHYAEDNERLFNRYFAGEDVFGDVRDKPVDSIRYPDIPPQEFAEARRKMLNVLRRRGYDIADVEPVLKPQRPPQPKGIKRIISSLLKAD